MTYEKPEAKVTTFDNSDVISTSDDYKQECQVGQLYVTGTACNDFWPGAGA